MFCKTPPPAKSAVVRRRGRRLDEIVEFYPNPAGNLAKSPENDILKLWNCLY